MNLSNTTPAWSGWIPSSVIGLPPPWHQHDMNFYQVAVNDEAIADALDVLERSLMAFAELPASLSSDPLPPEFGDYSTMVLDTVTIHIPTFEEFSLEPFATLLQRLGHDGNQVDLHKVARMWVYSKVDDLCTCVQTWLTGALYESCSVAHAREFIRISQAHWRSAPEDTVGSLLPMSSSIARAAGRPELAMPFIDEVRTSGTFSTETRDWADHIYQKLEKACAGTLNTI